MGLFHLKASSYRLAAQSFLSVTSDLSTHYSSILSLHDVVAYGILCALTCYTRREIKEYIIQNSELRKLFEDAPEYFKLVTTFYNSEYAQCFRLLEQLRCDLFLDRNISHHLPRLLKEIRSKGLIQYFKPYSSVKLSDMANNFKFITDIIGAICE